MVVTVHLCLSTDGCNSIFMMLSSCSLFCYHHVLCFFIITFSVLLSSCSLFCYHHVLCFVLIMFSGGFSSGESGLGKSTLINSLFLTDLYASAYPGPSNRIQKTVKVSTRLCMNDFRSMLFGERAMLFRERAMLFRAMIFDTVIMVQSGDQRWQHNCPKDG